MLAKKGIKKYIAGAELCLANGATWFALAPGSYDTLKKAECAADENVSVVRRFCYQHSWTAIIRNGQTTHELVNIGLTVSLRPIVVTKSYLAEPHLLL